MNYSAIKDFIRHRKNMYGFLSVAFLWLCIWGTYNTDITRLFSPGFPHGALDLVHGIRSLFPFLALVSVIFILIRRSGKKIELLKPPLFLFLLYAIVGITASFLSKDPLMSLYWGALYILVIFVLFAINSLLGNEKGVSFILWVNFFIASFLAVALTIFLFLKPGVFSWATVQQFFAGFRPYEGIGNIPVGEKIFGMVGTRPTGLGRYAAVAAIITFAQLWSKKKKISILYVALTIVFTGILFFSRARTSIIAFLCALFFISLFKVKAKRLFIFILILALLLLSLTNFYNYFWSYLVPESGATSGAPNVSPVGTQNSGFPDNNLGTLSGRTLIWRQVWNVFLTSPLIGRGFQADRIFLDGTHAHNTWLQVLIQSGTIGFIFFVFAFFISWIFLLYRFRYSSEKVMLVACLGVLTFFTVRSITESFAFFSSDWLFLAPFIAYMQFLNPKKPVILSGEKLPITILEKKFNAMEMPEAIKKINYWIEKERHINHWVVLCGMHGIAIGHKTPDFKEKINSADVSLMDGMSIVFLGRLMGFQIKGRVAGPDLAKEYLKFAEGNGHTSFFLGDTEDTLEKLNKKISSDFPNAKVAGSYSPPFREFTAEDDKKMIEIINQKKPDILWVAFNLQKQEEWIYRNRHKLQVPVVIGVGAVFKFLSGKVKRAPLGIRNAGFEWLWRLICEPKIIWRRVFLDGPIFVCLALRELIGPKGMRNKGR